MQKINPLNLDCIKQQRANALRSHVILNTLSLYLKCKRQESKKGVTTNMVKYTFTENMGKCVFIVAV